MSLIRLVSMVSLTFSTLASAEIIFSNEALSTNLLTRLILANGVLCFALALLNKSRPAKSVQKIKVVERVITLPPVPEGKTLKPVTNQIPVSKQTTEIIQKTPHLFDNKLTLTTPGGDITLSSEYGPDYFSENFTNFLKGTSSLYFSKKNDTAFVNFDIRDEGERVTMSATINNITLNDRDIMRDLSFNESDSACAIFNQIEENLNAHKPLINIRTGAKNTIVELSLTKSSFSQVTYN